MPQTIAVHWFRRDLRLEDNTALFHALESGVPVLPVFIFDTEILSKLEDQRDARVEFIHETLQKLQEQLIALGSSLLVLHGRPIDCWKELVRDYRISAVFTNRDYEPYARERDAAVGEFLLSQGIPFHTYKDHVIWEYHEVLKSDGTPYTVFTPYSKVWREKIRTSGGSVQPLAHFPSEERKDRFFQTPPLPMPSLGDLGFLPAGIPFPPDSVSQSLIKDYEQKRNFPAIAGTSRLGVHFRFGTISIREKARRALQLSDTFAGELIWRDFYVQILANFPHVARGAFRPAYDEIPWRDAPEDFARWCAGQTGYPLVDAGMRELNATGFMHNRVRMVVASFLSKHLLLDWRLGEAYFAQKLLDFDLASNNGGWQWAAGSGTDAAPYFRVFNPMAQQQKFDPDLVYIRRWVPEFGTPRYPKPIVEHTVARNRCLETYKAALDKGPK
jgi:deoxyribodipyrimidine photo-lyase